MSIKTEIIYLSDKKPEVEAFVVPVSEGVWYVWIDWFEAFEHNATGGGDDPNVVEMYFSHPASEDIDFQVNLHFPCDGFLFGQVCKKSYHGTFYSDEKYSYMIDHQINGEPV